MGFYVSLFSPIVLDLHEPFQNGKYFGLGKFSWIISLIYASSLFLLVFLEFLLFWCEPPELVFWFSYLLFPIFNLYLFACCYFFVAVCCSAESNSLQPHGLQHAGLPCPSPSPGAYSNSCPSSGWCHPTVSSSVVPFSSCLQSFPAPGSFQMSQFFTSGSQSIRVSASASVLPMNTQDWSPLGWTGWISLQSKGLSRVFFSTTVQKHQFFNAQLSL